MKLFTLVLTLFFLTHCGPDSVTDNSSSANNETTQPSLETSLNTENYELTTLNYRTTHSFAGPVIIVENKRIDQTQTGSGGTQTASIGTIGSCSRGEVSDDSITQTDGSDLDRKEDIQDSLCILNNGKSSFILGLKNKDDGEKKSACMSERLCQFVNKSFYVVGSQKDNSCLNQDKDTEALTFESYKEILQNSDLD